MSKLVKVSEEWKEKWKGRMKTVGVVELERGKKTEEEPEGNWGEGLGGLAVRRPSREIPKSKDVGKEPEGGWEEEVEEVGGGLGGGWSGWE